MGERNHEVVAFLLGAAAGGIAALLLAPSSGTELRGKIGDTATKARDDARGQMNAVGNLAQARYEEATQRAQTLVTDAKGSADHYRHAVTAAVKEGVKAYERETAKVS